MKRKHSDILRKKLNEVPMPQPGWEARMASYILNYEQEKRPQLVTWLAELSGFFYRYKVAGPALAVALLGLSYFIQPIHLYNSVAAEREEAILYLEEVTQVADYEVDFDEWTSSWIINY